jgi:cholest-4-en-3-one 26-monooxygenase
MANFHFDNPDQYVNGTPHDAFSQLRKTAPFAWHPSFQNRKDGFWLATKWCDIISISKNPRMFASFAPLLGDPVPMETWATFPALAMVANNLMTFDEQKHPVFRGAVNRCFAAGKLAAIEASVRRVVIEVMQRVSKKSHFDFAQEVALAIPVEIVLGGFLGFPECDLARLTRCTLTINAMDDPMFRPTPSSLMDAAEELYRYGLAHKRRLETIRSEDPLSEILRDNSVDNTTKDELFFAYWFPIVAGAFDTTASTIAGGVRALLQFPDQLERLRRDPAIVPLAVEEMLRWVSPVIYFRRTATTDTELYGHRLGKGHKIVLCYASANRDEDAFPDADVFDVGRNPNNHVAFGYGPHFCLGARLATTILRVFLEESVERISKIKLAGPVIHTRSYWMNRIRYMPVTNIGTPGRQ